MARVDLPPSRVKARRRRMYRRLAFVFCGLLLLACGLLVAAAHAPFLQITAVHVSGVATLATSSVQEFVGKELEGNYWFVLPKHNIFLYPKQTLRDGLFSHYPVLASVEVKAENFHAISVALVEREPRALWCADAGVCYFMDENGIVYAEAPVFSSPVYVPYFGAVSGNNLPKQFLTAEQFGALAALVDATAQKLSAEQLQKVAVDDHQDVRMEFASGFALLFSLRDQGGDVFERLTLALTAEPLTIHKLSDFEYLDLRFGDKLYYKLKSQVETE